MPTTYSDPIASAIQIAVSSLLIDGEQITNTVAAVNEVSISQQEGLHDTATVALKFQGTKMDGYIDKSVSFTYGPDAAFNRFYGYVSDITPSRNYKSDLTVLFECMGVTRPMRHGKPRFMKDLTVTQAVNEIVTPYRLGTLIEEFKLRDKPYKWPALAQTHESDFEFVVELAHSVGFCVFVNDGVLRIVDPVKVLKNSSSFITLYKSDEIEDNSRTLLDWEPTTQSLQVRQRQQPKYGYFAASGTNYTPVVSSDVEALRLDTDEVTIDQTMADVRQQAWDTTPEQWAHHAIARIVGNAEIIPGMIVSIRISGSNVVRNDYDGVWLVMGVEHILTQNGFQTALTLARTPVARRGTADYSAWFQSAQRPRPHITKRTLANKESRWESSWAGWNVTSPVVEQAQASSSEIWKATV